MDGELLKADVDSYQSDYEELPEGGGKHRWVKDEGHPADGGKHLWEKDGRYPESGGKHLWEKDD